jgi:peroxiredoxin
MRTLLALALLLLSISPASARSQGPWIGLVLDKGTQGSRVKEVVENSPGQRAGIVAGEEVLSLDKTDTTAPEILIDAVKRAGVGQVVKLKVLDGKGVQRVVSLKLEARPEMSELQRNALVGKSAPDFTPAVLTGAKLGKLSSLKGQVVLIDFFATWCGPCVASMPHINGLHETLGAKGLKVIGVSTESADIVGRVAERFKLKYSIAADENEGISRSYKVYALPTMVVIDRQGKVTEIAVADTDAVDAAVERALKAK